MPAKYIGLDAVTGLSILKLASKNIVPAGVITNEPVETGDAVLLYGPEPVTKPRTFFNSLYVRMGAIEGRVQDVHERAVRRCRAVQSQLTKAHTDEHRRRRTERSGRNDRHRRRFGRN